MANSRGANIVLGIDPGLAHVGWGVIREKGASCELLEYGHLATSPDNSHAERLLAVHLEIIGVIDTYRPEVMAVEEIFHGRNARSSLLAGEGRAACILAGALRELQVVEIPNNIVKLAVTGNGRASKQQVQAMVRRLLELSDDPRPADAADALAVALTHARRRQGRIRI